MEHTVESEEIRETLNNVRDINVQQLKVLKKQLNLTRLISLILIIALVVLFYYLSTMYTRINSTLDDIQVVSSQLADADWPGMIENINKLVTTSQQSIQAAIYKIENIDIDALNRAIQDLNSVIAPLARFFGN